MDRNRATPCQPRKTSESLPSSHSQKSGALKSSPRVVRSDANRDVRALTINGDFNVLYDLANHLKLKDNITRDEPQPAFYWNTFETSGRDFGQFDLGSLARKVLGSANAGGNSIISEAMSAELLERLYGASNIRTEMEVEYIFSNWKIADFCIHIYGKNVGVSVTRALGYPSERSFTAEKADELLRKKINGLVLARNGISDRDSFYTSILHIFAQSTRIKNLLFKAYKELDSDLKDNVIIICTVAEGADFIFKNPKK